MGTLTFLWITSAVMLPATVALSVEHYRWWVGQKPGTALVPVLTDVERADRDAWTAEAVEVVPASSLLEGP